jgi:adenylylsulfate kinase-like enzyme
MTTIAPATTLTACCVWLTGPTGSGKRTIARRLDDALRQRGITPVLLDDETVSTHLANGVESVAWLCRLLVTCGKPVIVSISVPGRRDRDEMRYAIPGFVEVFVDRGRQEPGYEEPFAPELRVPTHDREPAASVAQLLSWLEDVGYVEAE